MERDWKKFNKSSILKLHGDVYMYRDLYKGRHAKYSPRATRLIEDGEVIDFLEGGRETAVNVRTPYIIANISKVICDVPKLLISGSMKDIVTNHKDVVLEEIGEEKSIENKESDNENLLDLQQEMINQIVDNSNLTSKHEGNILMHQVDGGIVGVPQIINGKPSIAFKDRTVYFPHDDGKGADLMYEIETDDDTVNDYVHKYTERELDDSLKATNELFKRGRDGKMERVTDRAEIREVLGHDLESKIYTGRHRMFIRYFGNNVSHIDKLGHSELEGLEGKQEEINWTITRTAITFERNGKPRISVTPEIMQRLQQIAKDKYDDETKIDHRDLEVTTMNEQGRSVELHTVDIEKVGDMKYVKDIIRIMMAETNTSEMATEFLSERSGVASAQSGVAKFYDLFHSLTKAEPIRNGYVEFLRDLFEGTLWLINSNINNRIIVEKPVINVGDMITKPKDESDKTIIEKYEKGLLSLESAIKELNPEKDDDWVLDEVARIQDEKASDDSFSLLSGRQSIQGMFGNRDSSGNPLNNDGTVVDDNSGGE